MSTHLAHDICSNDVFPGYIVGFTGLDAGAAGRNHQQADNEEIFVHAFFTPCIKVSPSCFKFSSIATPASSLMSSFPISSKMASTAIAPE
ncbi:hypothetical protein Mfla_2722 [Methylobacillus flagellatus KT]|uniref:Uncharacterized protein n=1 Tax=Methylobacillus flagellatus (strain ATCC 51484 / DSM 6875 / VKM B-1610 / KT) TaxID=265072 RepID=Q1GXQ2_METFK|nr:hypothetical protein Mfla_2722 [Methylobacillus flagellatus KT]